MHLGTLDISIVEIKSGKFEVKAITGDPHLGSFRIQSIGKLFTLGGQDFDGKMMNYVITEFKKSYPDYDIYHSPKLLKSLRIKCREAKEVLSFTKTSINIKV